MTKLAFLMVTLIAGFSPAARADTKYPLTCRGGGQLQWYVNTNLNMSLGANSLKNNLMLTFNRAPVAAYGGLKAGECAWADRAVNNTEPFRICFSNISIDIAFDVSASGTFTAIPLNGADVFNGLRRDSQYMTFWVYNDRQGCFRT